MSDVLALDTSAAVYLLQREPREGQEADWRLAQLLLEHSDFKFALPAAVVSELLSSSKRSERDSVEDALRRGFRVLSYDERAARLAARLVVKNGPVGQKRKMKHDAQILGTAARWSSMVVGLCTYDSWQRDTGAPRAVKLVPGFRCGPPDDFLEGCDLLVRAVKAAAASPADLDATARMLVAKAEASR